MRAPTASKDAGTVRLAFAESRGSNVKPFALTSDELAIVKAGLTDAVTSAKPQVELDQYGPKVKELAQKRAAAGAEEAKKERTRIRGQRRKTEGRFENRFGTRHSNRYRRCRPKSIRD
jgi:hypothetical protein